ncbi:MAG: DUF4363 family protein [Oscillospiraceae bacterium]
MNRLVVSIIILALLSALCVGSVLIVDNVTESMSAKVDAVEQAFQNGDKDACTSAADALQEQWHTFMHYSVLINDLGHAVEITSTVAEIASFAQEQDDELYAACDRAQALIIMLRDIQKPTLWNIL